MLTMSSKNETDLESSDNAKNFCLGPVVNSWLAYNSFLNSNTNPNALKKKHVILITQFKEELACSFDGCAKRTTYSESNSNWLLVVYLTLSPFVGAGPRKCRARKVCKTCYKRVSEEKGRNVAGNMIQVATFCKECPEKSFLCQKCFRDVHK
uniref:Uncharacterized protein n=1 Tax=Homalodisca liturata TaxID=320908 RepID=A0A1B6K4P3_9HEMI